MTLPFPRAEPNNCICFQRMEVVIVAQLNCLQSLHFTIYSGPEAVPWQVGH